MKKTLLDASFEESLNLYDDPSYKKFGKPNFESAQETEKYRGTFKGNWKQTDSKTVVGKVAKTAIGASIDTVSSIGPLDGMWLGAKIGASSTHPVGIVAGSLFGLGVGAANLMGDVFFPEQKQAVDGAIKDGAYWLVDRGEEIAESTGKAIQAGWEELKSVGKNVSEFFQGALDNSLSWFGG